MGDKARSTGIPITSANRNQARGDNKPSNGGYQIHGHRLLQVGEGPDEERCVNALFLEKGLFDVADDAEPDGYGDIIEGSVVSCGDHYEVRQVFNLTSALLEPQWKLWRTVGRVDPLQVPMVKAVVSQTYLPLQSLERYTPTQVLPSATGGWVAKVLQELTRRSLYERPDKVQSNLNTRQAKTSTERLSCRLLKVHQKQQPERGDNWGLFVECTCRVEDDDRTVYDGTLIEFEVRSKDGHKMPRVIVPCEAKSLETKWNSRKLVGRVMCEGEGENINIPDKFWKAVESFPIPRWPDGGESLKSFLVTQLQCQLFKESAIMLIEDREYFEVYHKTSKKKTSERRSQVTSERMAKEETLEGTPK
ncbi:hypothetical protein ISF_03885 [Cordyceps fumosorosea ARSEF 2679]|uniref:Uncharacterized protein n=1 Tax=Cordyceps fumosorosea (strain ARSEF 2679) TaxID=1081104 RepID=A0A167YA22_CORFA|nr:hypothetical protein ISF_03885 [Cordyceps fumosorosea ARSEF 2679]OAA66047.1 hypothetical protein ISF_03885 [Cordyceps fumosorosea ARSEF 2679]